MAAEEIHSPGWNWRRTAKDCVEAFAFFVLSIPIIVRDLPLLGISDSYPVAALLERPTMERLSKAKAINH